MSFRLSPSQSKLINFDEEGVLVIRGAAGAGKTTVLLERAKALLSAHPKASVLMLTYNDALVSHIKHHLANLKAGDRLKVCTVHKWAKEFAQREGVEFPQFFWATSNARDEFLKVILKHPPVPLKKTRLEGWTLQQWSEEVEWLIGQDIPSLEAYRKARRRGRGHTGGLPPDERRVIWAVFERYRKDLATDGSLDIHDFLGLLRMAEQKKGISPKATFDFVLIDEVQDLDLAWLKAVSSIARVGTTFAGDLAQRIYRRHFTWKAAGIHLPPARSRFLEGTHRSPQTLMAWAKKVLGEPGATTDLGFESPDPSQISEDWKDHMVLIQHDKGSEAVRRALEFAIDLKARGRDVVVVAPFQAKAEQAARALKSLGVNASFLLQNKLVERHMDVLPVTTFHQMKGLECMDLVILGMEDKLYPGWYLKGLNESEAADKMIELRNLLHMLITRARGSVTVCVGGALGRFL